MRPVRFLGNSLQCLRDFPEDARHVEEIRVADESGVYRVIYLAKRPEAVYVLHAFQKKSQATSRRDITLAKKRFAEVLGGKE